MVTLVIPLQISVKSTSYIFKPTGTRFWKSPLLYPFLKNGGVPYLEFPLYSEWTIPLVLQGTVLWLPVILLRTSLFRISYQEIIFTKSSFRLKVLTGSGWAVARWVACLVSWRTITVIRLIRMWLVCFWTFSRVIERTWCPRPGTK